MSIHTKKSTPIEDPLHLLPRLLTKLYSWWVSATYPFAAKGGKLSIHFSCELRRSRAPRIAIGDSVCIAKDAWIGVNPASDGPGPAIVLGDRCIVARRSMISAKNSIQLEQDVILSPSVLIMDHSHEYEDVTRPIEEQGVTPGGTVRIGQGTWIGHGAAVLCNKGELIIGRNCVIAANSVVTRSCPDYSVVSGNPARVVQQFDRAKQTWVMGSSRSLDAESEKPARTVLVRQ